MKSSEQLRKPENWQDFEKLCLKLWGAIWNKEEEIEFNSSNSQGQKGVDIFCWVDKYNGHVGIQCKNKKEEKLNGEENKLDLSTLKDEIAEAEKFLPPLKHYIIATSSEKDGKIQEAIRIIDAERRAEGKFSVEIKFWDYIVMKIDEHKTVHDWYLKSINFKTNQSVKLTFDNCAEEITLKPIFSRDETHYIYTESIINTPNIISNIGVLLPYNDVVKYNRGFVPIAFKVSNIGNTSIENWKIKIDAEGDYTEIAYDNKVKGTGGLASLMVKYQAPDLHINSETFQIISRYDRDFLVSGDDYTFGKVYIKPKKSTETTEIKLNWRLLSKDFQDSGTLTVKVEPIIKKKRTLIPVYNIEEEKPIKYGEIVDYISSNNEGD